MDGIILGLIGGAVPATAMVVCYFFGIEKRLTQIETHIKWIIGEFSGCQPLSDDHTK